MEQLLYINALVKTTFVRKEKKTPNTLLIYVLHTTLPQSQSQGYQKFLKTRRCQTAHHWVIIKIFTGLWLLLMGQSEKILVWVSTVLQGKNILSINSGVSLILKFWIPDVMHTEGIRIFELYDRFDRQKTLPNSKLFFQGPRWVRILKKCRSKAPWHTLFNLDLVLMICTILN